MHSLSNNLGRFCGHWHLWKIWCSIGLVILMLMAMNCRGNQPNILWLTSEDNGPHIGAFDDTFADTPNIDRLASNGMSYLNCWSNAPVCAPARTALISGVFPPSTGAEHMRSETRLAPFMKMYPQYLRQAGYYCTNNSKEDYNLAKPGDVWNESSNKAHWKNRADGQPFFAVFNYTISHESQIRKRPHAAVHDPGKVRVPAYHPDTHEVRQDWAQYYDKVTEMDVLVGRALDELDQAGLTDETIIFYFGDHGSGMPRNKRWPYNSGLHVPLIVSIPEKFQNLAGEEYRPGARSTMLVSFVDMAPTLLSLAGVKPPYWYQGHAFLGPYAGSPRHYVHGFRGRMDERYDLVRSVRDHRYVYIRNYMPHKIYGQHISYMFETPTTRVWKQLYDMGALSPVQSRFWQSKPSEELYDLWLDPDEVNNLAASPEHAEVLNRFRSEQMLQIHRIHDVGFLPEAEIHQRSQNFSHAPWLLGRHPEHYPLERIVRMADLASNSDHSPSVTEQLISGLEDSDSAVRYWAAMGLGMRGAAAVTSGRSHLIDCLSDPSLSVRVTAAEALAHHGAPEDLDPCLDTLIHAADYRNSDVYIATLAMNVIDQLDEKARKLVPAIRQIPTQISGYPGRASSYIERLVETTLHDLGIN